MRPDNAARVRPDVVRAVRHQLATGVYDPPVNELVERLVSVVIARRAPHAAGRRQ